MIRSVQPSEPIEKLHSLSSRRDGDCSGSQGHGYWVEHLNASTSPKVDTTNWKTYRSYEFSFEVRYPQDWEMTILSRDEEHLSIALDKDMIFNIWAGRIGTDPDATKILAANCPNAKVGGEDAVVASGDYPLSVYLQTNAYSYTLYDPHVIGHAIRTSETNLILEQIVRSFRLL
jgi:hypothetical protein